MTKPPLIRIENPEDIKKILLVQRLIARRAKDELARVSADAAATPATALEEKTRLLQKYANHPTLSEFAANPNLKHLTKWGATLGLSVLIGELVLAPTGSSVGEMQTVVSPMFLLFLNELDNPKHDNLVEPLEKSLKITSVQKETSPEERKAYTRRLLTRLVEHFVIYATELNLVTHQKRGYSITPLGKRVFAHLIDSQNFLTLMMEAHQKFQNTKPRLSIV